jgi:glyoxylase-like metal-dependent hydrolase (beta-lactamase superfamily II)
MVARRQLFPNVIEMNHQARRRLGCCVYLVHDADEWMLIDVGYEETVREIVDLIRRLDFQLAKCRYIVATHADADHIQGLPLRDGCVGNIDAHHGSDIPQFIASLTRIRDSGVEWLLPSHGPAFRNERPLLQATIDRLEGYKHMADFGTCAVDWPLLDEWEAELAAGDRPARSQPKPAKAAKKARD